MRRRIFSILFISLSVILAGFGSVYSADSGEWISLENPHIMGYVIDAVISTDDEDNRYIYAVVNTSPDSPVTDAVIIRSNNDGSSWTEIEFTYFKPYAIEGDPNDPDNLVVAARYPSGSYDQVFTTTNATAQDPNNIVWYNRADGLPGTQELLSLKVDTTTIETDSVLVFTAYAGFIAGNDDEALYWTTDGGQNWYDRVGAYPDSITDRTTISDIEIYP